MHPASPTSAQAVAVPFREALRVWVRVALLSFGGPAGQIAVMHRILVDEKRWIDEPRFLHALNYCMLLPGPEAQQLATYIGWMLHGTRGGLVAGGLFVLPGFLSILLLSGLYVSFAGTAWLEGIFFGIQAAVLAIVVAAVRRIGARALHSRAMAGIAVAAFVAIFFFDAPFPLIIVAAALLGLVGGQRWPDAFRAVAGHGDAGGEAATPPATRTAGWRRAVRVLATWLLLWWLPILVVLATLGPDHVQSQLALFFSKLAVLTFGGAYAALAWMAQEAVQHHQWLQAAEMLDGLGMAETTPGPLIQVVQFIGFLAAWRHPAPFDPWTAALLASVLVTWATFAPCFLWIFLGAPYVERLRGNKAVASALAGITAAVLGVMLNLAVWFALHVWFDVVTPRESGWLRLWVPDAASMQPVAVVLSALALYAMLRRNIGLFPVLAACAVAGLAWRLLSG